MKLHCFVCSSLLYPKDKVRDVKLHSKYLKAHLGSIPKNKGVEITFLQNGCDFPVEGGHIIRNPFPKNVSYNLLMCDVNSRADYWLFLPEDCLLKPYGWQVLLKKLDKKTSECFSLSRDPKAIIGKKRIFQGLSEELLTLCDMNFLGKEIGCVILREELDKRGFHCISRNWKKISKNPDRWGNELYEEIDDPDHPNICYALHQPVLQDYGFDGWKASKEELEETFIKIVSHSLDSQRESARNLKGLISYYGPRISDVPYKGIFSNLINRVLRRKTFKPS